jgi:hypothetical protein
MFRCGVGALALGLVLVLPAPAPARELPKDYRPAVDKGLAWLIKQQQGDGRWDAKGDGYPTAMTALAGLALLMEGSTLREGTYRAQLQKATDWLLAQARPSGLITEDPRGGRQYMMAHGYAMLYLACVVGDLENGAQKRRALAVLERAAAFSARAQTSRGGWGYVSGVDADFDEIACTVIVLQGLEAARLAGVSVSAEALRAARDYLDKSTEADGSILYSLSGKARSQCPMAAACLAVSLAPADYGTPLGRKWLDYCRNHALIPAAGRKDSYGPFLHFYYAQVMYQLGDDRFATLFPSVPAADRLTWSKYRKALFDALVRAQTPAGDFSSSSWEVAAVGPVYTTACALFVLQLDNEAVPLFCRRR